MSDYETLLLEVHRHNAQQRPYLDKMRRAWVKEHGRRVEVPIYKDEQGRMFWANRKQRRELEATRKKDKKKPSSNN